MIIDLHGCSHRTAEDIVVEKLVNASTKGSFDAEIITGKSVIMERIVINILEQLGFDYVTFPEDFGTVYVSYTPL
jgi:DNA-nicking Smr family endonuclease